MELYLQRSYHASGTNGVLRHHGQFLCFTIELPWKGKLKLIGIALATVSAALLAAPIALPAIVTTIAGYMAVAGTVASAVSAITVES
jgi:hypothetical protein